jgi:hypothetical protein
VFGEWLTEKIWTATLLGQFTGGVDEKAVEEMVRKLATRNISTIWFFSIERDLE